MTAFVETSVRQGLVNLINDEFAPDFKVFYSMPEFVSKQDAVSKFMTGDNTTLPRVLRLAILNLESILPGELGCDDNPSFIVRYNCRLFVGFYGTVNDDTTAASAYSEVATAASNLVASAVKNGLTLALPDNSRHDMEIPTIQRLDTGVDDIVGLAGASADVVFEAEIWQTN